MKPKYYVDLEESSVTTFYVVIKTASYWKNSEAVMTTYPIVITASEFSPNLELLRLDKALLSRRRENVEIWV